MSTMHNPHTDRADGALGGRDAGPAATHQPDTTADDPQPTLTATDHWVPEDRAPSAAESNFMSVSLFAFLILFGIGCFIIF